MSMMVNVENQTVQIDVPSTYTVVSIPSTPTFFYFTRNVTVNQWQGSTPPYTAVVTNAQIKKDDFVLVDVVTTGDYSTDYYMLEEFEKIYYAKLDNGSITLFAYQKPSYDLSIQFLVVRPVVIG